MAVTKTRGANKKLGEIGLGHRITRFRVEKVNRKFAVHDDLVCSSSDFFKDRLQKNRKALDGDCAICTEPLDPHVRDITFCRAQCGQNVHEECYEQWSKSQETCPSCRSPWKDLEDAPISIDSTLDQKAIEVYLKWLYSGGTSPIDSPLQIEQLEIVDVFLTLLRAHTVGVIMKDNVFKNTVAGCFKDHWKAAAAPYSLHPTMRTRIDLIRNAYNDETIGNESKHLVVLLHVAIALCSKDWFTTFSNYYPITFVKLVGDACFRTMKTNTTFGVDEVFAEFIGN